MADWVGKPLLSGKTWLNYPNRPKMWGVTDSLVNYASSRVTLSVVINTSP